MSEQPILFMNNDFLFFFLGMSTRFLNMKGITMVELLVPSKQLLVKQSEMLAMPPTQTAISIVAPAAPQKHASASVSHTLIIVEMLAMLCQSRLRLKCRSTHLVQKPVQTLCNEECSLSKRVRGAETGPKDS